MAQSTHSVRSKSVNNVKYLVLAEVESIESIKDIFGGELWPVHWRRREGQISSVGLERPRDYVLRRIWLPEGSDDAKNRMDAVTLVGHSLTLL